MTNSSKNKKTNTSRMSSNQISIVDAILQDHKDLKHFIEILKDKEVDLDTKQQCFDEFTELLLAHAKSEQEVLYEFLKKNEDLRMEALEGFTEHAVAESLARTTQKADDDDTWEANAKVLAEVVEHHIEEEETDLLKQVKKTFDKDTLQDLGRQFLIKRARKQPQVHKDNAGVLARM